MSQYLRASISFIILILYWRSRSGRKLDRKIWPLHMVKMSSNSYRTWNYKIFEFFNLTKLTLYENQLNIFIYYYFFINNILIKKYVVNLSKILFFLKSFFNGLGKYTLLRCTCTEIELKFFIFVLNMCFIR